MKKIFVMSCLWTLSACGNDALDQFRQALPSEQAVTIKAPENNASALTADVAVGEKSDFYQTTRDISRGVNGSIRAIVLLIKAVVAQPPTTIDGDRLIWGPGNDDALSPSEFRLVAEKKGDGRFSYRLEYKPKDAADTDSNYKPLITGDADNSKGHDEGEGTMTLMIDNWAAAEDSNCGAGTLHVRYDTTVEPKFLSVDFEDFVDCENHGDNKPLHAASYFYSRANDGSGNFQFVAEGDIHEGSLQPVVNETLAIRSRWNASGEGRSDVRVSGGDLTVSEVTANECWDSAFHITFADLTPAEIDPSHVNVGDAANCPANMQDPLYASDI